MTYLLDTHTFIWAVLETGKLSKNAYGLLTDAGNKIHVSVVSFWEISLKTGIKKFSFENLDVKDFPRYARDMGFEIMDLQETPAMTFHELPLKRTHKDPFDRMLIWQAITKNMTLISKDELFDQYRKDGLRIAW